MHRLVIVAAAFGVCIGVSTIASAQALKAFTHVDDVCEKCTGGPAFDRILLRSGEVIRASVIAENDAFYTVERFGELRAIARDQVQNLMRNPGGVRPTGFGDQILLKDNIVLAGTIDGVLPATGDHFEIKIPGTVIPLHEAARETVAAIYRGGKRVYSADK